MKAGSSPTACVSREGELIVAVAVDARGEGSAVRVGTDQMVFSVSQFFNGELFNG